MSIVPGGYDDCHHNKGGTTTPTVPSLRAKRSNPVPKKDWIASPLSLLAMTMNAAMSPIRACLRPSDRRGLNS
jgi:hypothetical protein